MNNNDLDQNINNSDSAAEFFASLKSEVEESGNENWLKPDDLSSDDQDSYLDTLRQA